MENSQDANFQGKAICVVLYAVSELSYEVEEGSLFDRRPRERFERQLAACATTGRRTLATTRSGIRELWFSFGTDVEGAQCASHEMTDLADQTQGLVAPDFQAVVVSGTSSLLS